MIPKKPLTLTIFLLRLLSGLGGGVAGTLVAFVVYFLLARLIPLGQEGPLSLFTTVLVVFGGTLTANTATVAIATFMDEEKYSRRKTMILHVFLFNLILFLLTLPLYFISLSFDFTSQMMLVHLLLSAFVSAVVMEVLAGRQYSLLGVYASTVGIFVCLSLALLISQLNLPAVVLPLAAMPVVWVVLQITGGAGEWAYDLFVRLYGLDALSTETDLGGDQKPEPPESDDEDKDEKEDMV